MALNRSKLSSLLATFLGSPEMISSRQESEVRWTNAYHSYAQDAEDVSGDRVVVVNQPAFLSTLNLGSEQSSISAARSFDQAFVAYWTGGIFGVGSLAIAPPVQCPNVGGNLIWASEITSLVVAVVPNILAGLLQPIFARTNDSDTALSKASEIAGAFHKATTTAVTVTITGLDTTPGPAGPLPITNTCTIR